MKATFKLLAVLALMLATFSQHTTVSAGGGGAFNFRGPSALASFSSTDPSSCIVTDVFVIASDAVFQGEPGPSTVLSFASVTISKYNACTDTQLLFAYGSASPLTKADFQVSKTLDSATLNVIANVFDERSGKTFDVNVNLSWTGAGLITRQESNTHFHSPGCFINSRSNGTFRSAEVSGSISDGVTNFTPAPSLDANIASVKSGNVVIGCS